MHEISLVVFWLQDLKGVEKPPPCGAGQKLPQAPGAIQPQCGPSWSLQEGAGGNQNSLSCVTALVIYK